MPRKIQIEFSDRALEMLDTLGVASHRKSVADVVRDALALYDWCRKQMAAGYTICAVKEGVPVREVILPFEQGGV